MQKMKWIAAVGGALVAGGLMVSPVLADGPAPAAKKKAAPAPAAAPAKADRHDWMHDRPAIGGWSGLYAGASLGYSWGDVESRFPTTPGSLSEHASPDDGILGGHVGIQHQWGRIVVGVEAGYSGTGLFGDGWDGGACRNPPVTDRCQGRIDSLFTIGPRLGLAHDRFMFYVTGGFASARIDTQVLDALNVRVASSASRNNGWFIGAGAEMKLHDRWVAGLEYIHADFDSESQYNNIPPPGTVKVDGDQDILRFRLSYMLSRPAPKAEPMK
jgi:outer membrane immunogenic protein